MRSIQTVTRSCEMQHLFKETGVCDGGASHRIVTDHGEARFACATYVEYLQHCRSRCSRCRKPLVWCWKVDALAHADS